MPSATAPRTPQQSRAQRTRARLVEAAQAEFSECGYAGATARSIAERAGVSVGSFYQYFPDKDELLRELARARAAGISGETLGHLEAPGVVSAEELPQLVRARMRRVVQAVVDQHREDPGLHAVLTERRHVDEVLDEFTGASERAMVERITMLLTAWGHPGDREATAFVLFSMVEGAVHTHVLGAAAVSDERFLDALVDALVRVAWPHRGE